MKSATVHIIKNNQFVFIYVEPLFQMGKKTVSVTA